MSKTVKAKLRRKDKKQQREAMKFFSEPLRDHRYVTSKQKGKKNNDN